MVIVVGQSNIKLQTDHTCYKMENGKGLLLLEKCELSNVASVLHGVVDGICKGRKMSYKDNSKCWDLHEWWTVLDTYQNFMKKCVRNAWTKDQISQALPELSDDLKQAVLDVVSVRYDDIQQQLKLQATAISQTMLSDFDWQAKLVMSSDKLSTLQEPLLSLDLDLESTGKQFRKLSVELTKEDLKHLITSLEGANKVVQQLKS